MIIGNFKKTGDSYEGKIETFVFSVPARIEPVSSKTNDKAPDYHIVSNGREIGAAWKKTSQKDGKEYMSVTLEYPGLDTGCALFKTTEGDGLVLAWNRPRERD